MKFHMAEVGERYADDSGWEKRALVNLQEGILEIELEGGKLRGHPRDLRWLLDALFKLQSVVLANE